MAWTIFWTSEAKGDVRRHKEYLSLRNPESGHRIAKSLTNTPKTLWAYPRMGEELKEFQPREVRRLIVEGYEFRYEIRGAEIRVLRIFHGREDR